MIFYQQEIIEHEDYGPILIQNDIAIMILSTPAELNDYVQPVCLPAQDDLFVGQQAIVSGWGGTASGLISI